MGYFEIYCLACGGPCVDVSLDTLENQYDEAETRHEKTKIKKIINGLQQINTSWVEDWVVVSKKGTYQGTPNGDYPASIENLEPLGSTPTDNVPERFWCVSESNVYAFHTVCWKIINEPTYEDLQLLNLKRHTYANTVTDESVYPLCEMMGQDFDCELDKIKQSQFIHLKDPSKFEESAQHVRATWEKVKKITNVKKTDDTVVDTVPNAVST